MGIFTPRYSPESPGEYLKTTYTYFQLPDILISLVCLKMGIDIK